MFNPSLPRENADAQAASTDGRATLYANGQEHMFERKKRCNKKTTGGFEYKKTKFCLPRCPHSIVMLILVQYVDNSGIRYNCRELVDDFYAVVRDDGRIDLNFVGDLTW
jgi:hypothetical protein